MPQAFLAIVGKPSIVEVELGDNKRKNMTILFSDIRNFTTLSEAMTPDENFAFINAYLERMGPVIRDHNGFIDKYIGDAIMALFESPTMRVRAGLAMLDTLDAFNAERRAAGLEPIGIGIGINTGSLMLGTIGEKHRMDGTVISDAVNLASRIESLTKDYHVGLLISQFTVESSPIPRPTTSVRSTSSWSRARPTRSPSARCSSAIRPSSAPPRPRRATCCSQASRRWRARTWSAPAGSSRSPCRSCPATWRPAICCRSAGDCQRGDEREL